MLHLLYHAHLYSRHQVTQHQELSSLVTVRNFGIKIRQYVQVSDQRVTAVHILMVAATPEKGFFIRDNLYPIQMYIPVPEVVHFFLRKIIAHDRNLLDRFYKIGSGISHIGSRATYYFICFAKRGFNCIEGHCAYRDQRHSFLLTGFIGQVGYMSHAGHIYYRGHTNF